MIFLLNIANKNTDSPSKIKALSPSIETICSMFRLRRTVAAVNIPKLQNLRVREIEYFGAPEEDK